MVADSSLPTKGTKLLKKVSECTLGKFFHFPYSFFSLSLPPSLPLKHTNYSLSLSLPSRSNILSTLSPSLVIIICYQCQKLHAIIWKATFLIIKLHQRKNSRITNEAKARLKRIPFCSVLIVLPLIVQAKKELIKSKRTNQS